mgnify:FL=1
MLEVEESRALLAKAELVFDEVCCEVKLKELATRVTEKLSDEFPLVIALMNGAAVFAGKLLPLLNFPLQFESTQVSRYRNQLRGATLEWQHPPRGDLVKSHTVLLLDDVLDEGHTLLAVRKKILSLGAKACYSAVFVEKILDVAKPISADFVALQAPNCYLFGYGMDVKGYWRNLPAVYALA